MNWRCIGSANSCFGHPNPTPMYSAAYGGIAFGDIQSNNLAVTGGVRFRF
jgi:hypothetical protein